MRVLIEVLHVLAGLMVTALIAGLSAWGYPRATNDIWLVAGVVMVAVLLMGVKPVIGAFRRDAQTLKGVAGKGVAGKGSRGNE